MRNVFTACVYNYFIILLGILQVRKQFAFACDFLKSHAEIISHMRKMKKSHVENKIQMREIIDLNYIQNFWSRSNSFSTACGVLVDRMRVFFPACGPLSKIKILCMRFFFPACGKFFPDVKYKTERLHVRCFSICKVEMEEIVVFEKSSNFACGF